MRLFTALDLPPEIVDRLGQLIARLKPAARIKWSPPANLHVTTKFIGEWPEERVDELKSVLASIPSRPPIAVNIHGLGFAPNPKSPRNFWCGVVAPGLAELAADIDAATAPLGIANEKRPYSPHLTLARIKDRLDLRAAAPQNLRGSSRFRPLRSWRLLSLSQPIETHRFRVH